MKILFFTLLPAIIVGCFFYFANRFKDSKFFIAKAFGLGILICFPAGYLNTYVLQTFTNNNPINNALLVGFFAGGLVEELLKFLSYEIPKESFKYFPIYFVLKSIWIKK